MGLNSKMKAEIKQAFRLSKDDFETTISRLARRYGENESRIKALVQPVPPPATGVIIAREKPIIAESIGTPLEEHELLLAETIRNYEKSVEVTESKVKKTKDQVDWKWAGVLSGITRKVNIARREAESKNLPFNMEEFKTPLINAAKAKYNKESFSETIAKKATELVQRPVQNTPVIEQKLVAHIPPKEKEQLNGKSQAIRYSGSLKDLKDTPEVLGDIVRDNIRKGEPGKSVEVKRDELVKLEKEMTDARAHLFVAITIIRNLLK